MSEPLIYPQKPQDPAGGDPASTAVQGALKPPNPQDIEAELHRLNQHTQELLSQQQRESEPVLSKMQTEVEKGGPPVPTLEEPPKFEAPKDQQGTLKNFFMASIGLSFLAGALTRQHVNGAMAAFRGAMEGYNEGKLQQAQQARQNFKLQLEALQERNQRIMADFQLASEKHKNDLDGLRNELELIGAKYGLPLAIDKAQTGDLLATLKVYQAMETAHQNFMLKAQNAEGLMLWREWQMTSKHNETVRHDRAMENKGGAGHLTPTQVDKNEKIDAARELLRSRQAQDPEAFKALLADAVHGIFPNKEFGPQLSLALTHKYGEDATYGPLHSWAAGYGQHPTPPPAGAAGQAPPLGAGQGVPAIPDALSRIPGLQWNPRLRQWRDPRSGDRYDENGALVRG